MVFSPIQTTRMLIRLLCMRCSRVIHVLTFSTSFLRIFFRVSSLGRVTRAIAYVEYQIESNTCSVFRSYELWIVDVYGSLMRSVCIVGERKPNIHLYDYSIHAESIRKSTISSHIPMIRQQQLVKILYRACIQL